MLIARISFPQSGKVSIKGDIISSATSNRSLAFPYSNIVLTLYLSTCPSIKPEGVILPM
jgi:hypothetical protein